MTRPLQGPPARHPPRRRRSFLPLPVLGILVAAVLGASACIGGETVATSSPAASSAGLSASPSAPTSPSTSIEPSLEPTASPAPTEAPTQSASASDDPSVSGATSEVCTGTADNREFFATAAERFDWPVYCPVLPARWNVVTGSFGSGRLDITYQGPNGARLSLQQGAIGDDLPPGTDSGDAPFGDQSGTFVQLDDGGWAIAVDRGSNPSWTVVGTGMDEATFRTSAADLARLD